MCGAQENRLVSLNIECLWMQLSPRPLKVSLSLLRPLYSSPVVTQSHTHTMRALDQLTLHNILSGKQIYALCKNYSYRVPRHSRRKFSAVKGKRSCRSSNMIRPDVSIHAETNVSFCFSVLSQVQYLCQAIRSKPAFFPPIAMSKNTYGFVSTCRAQT